jgi:hypothetical protein
MIALGHGDKGGERNEVHKGYGPRDRTGCALRGVRG